MRRGLKWAVPTLLLAAGCLLMATVPTGCNASLQAQLDRAEVLYGTAVDETNTLYKQGAISYATFHDVITPARRTARETLDRAKLQNATGQVDLARLTLDAALDVLKQIDAQRAKATAKPAGTAPTTRPATVAPASPVGGSGPPPLEATGMIPAAIALLELIDRLTPVALKMFRGEELSPEERALAEEHSAAATAEADALDAAGPK